MRTRPSYCLLFLLFIALASDISMQNAYADAKKRPPSLFSTTTNPFDDTDSEKSNSLDAHTQSNLITGILFLDDKHWCLGIGDGVWTPQNVPAGYAILGVCQDFVEIATPDNPQGTRLHLGESIPDPQPN